MKKNHFIIIFTGYLIIWTIANFPALKVSWLICDDFSHITDWMDWYKNGGGFRDIPTRHAFVNGRPFAFILYSTFLIDGEVNGGLYNMILRYFQGIIHCLSVTIILVVLWHKTYKFNIIFYLIPFLIWPFNAEAVLWRAAIHYPVSALIISLGIYIINFNISNNIYRNLFGIVLIILAVCTNQLVSFLGIAIFVIILGVSSLNNKSIINKQTFNQISIVILGYIIGGILTYIIGATFGDRTNIANDVLGKILFLMELNHLVIFNSNFYPKWLNFLHALLVIVPILLMLLKIINNAVHSKKIIVALFCYLLLFVIPYTTILVAKENYPSWRVMYIAPIVFSSALIYIDHLFVNSKIKYIFIYPALLSIVICYVYISRINSSEYPIVFYNDLNRISEIENYLTDNKIKAHHPIHIVSYPDYIKTWNPYSVRYFHGDSKTSAMVRDWYLYPFMDIFSNFNLIQHDTSCIDYCKKNTSNHSMKFYESEIKHTLCICP